MKFRTFGAAAILSATLALGGCSTISGLFGGGAASDALKATQIALTTYADVYQPAVLTYGSLPVCPAGAPVCHDSATFAKLKGLDLQVTTAIGTAQCVLDQSCSDTGQVAALMTVLQQAETQIALSGAMSVKKGN